MFALKNPGGDILRANKNSQPIYGNRMATTLWYLWQRGKLSQFYNDMNEIEQRRPSTFMQNAICSLFYLIYRKKLNSPLDLVSYNFLFVQVANENKSKRARYKFAVVMGKSAVLNDMFPGDQRRTIEMLIQYEMK